MCGIVGFLGDDRSLLERMLKSIHHRGPDSFGIDVGPNFSIGMRRLSIIDISGGEQPVISQETGCKIVFNGELYNSPELRRQLQSQGLNFVSDHSDTETVLKAYEAWGSDCLTHLVGMFAFVISDPRTKNLFIARDRLGIKPLYYHCDQRRFLFASEIKAILQDPQVARSVNQSVMIRFLLYRVHDDGEDTFFEGIKRLLPGHYMIVSPDATIEITRYWEPNINDKFTSDRDDTYYSEQFGEIFEKVVRRHLLSDVPLGVSLSGGLDSSGIASMTNLLMKAGSDLHTQGGLHTFSALYPGQSIDESKYISEVEKFVSATPHYCHPSVDEFWDDIDTWIWFQEEPTISSAPYAYYSVYRIAKGQVKVILSGNGGDELLAGYIPYFKAYMTSAFDQKRYLDLMRELYRGRDLYGKYFAQFAKQKLTPAKNQISISSMLASIRPQGLQRTQTPGTQTPGTQTPSNFEFTPDRNLNYRLAQDVLRYSTPNLLRYEDKNSMAFSIESRVPFLDHELVEHIFSLPIDQKIKFGWNRYVYRNAMRNKMPELNRTRRSKIGFTNPEMEWMKHRSDQVREIFASDQLAGRGIFNQQAILDQFDMWLAGCPGDGLAFWRILVCELWMRRYIDRPTVL